MSDHPAWQATPDQELLLHAALGNGPDALAAWEQWIGRVDLERLDSGSHRMLGLLYRNLLRLKVTHPEMARLKGVYMHTWAVNQTAQRELGRLIQQLEAAGVMTIVLKGAAIAARYYRDMGVRPMTDFDILVPSAGVDAALALLQADGWTPQTRTYAQLALPYRTTLHARGFDQKARKLSFDLHWRALMTHLGDEDDASYWSAAEPLMLGKTQTRTLCSADQLVHLCIHGSFYDGNAQVRWLPDALVVLRHSPELDWNRVVAQAQRLEAAVVVGPKLTYLRERWGIAVPPTVTEQLAAMPVSYRTRRLYDAVATYSWAQSWPQLFWLLYSQYLSTLPKGSRRIRPLGFLRFLQHRWLVDSPVGMVRGGWARFVERRTRQRSAATT